MNYGLMEKQQWTGLTYKGNVEEMKNKTKGIFVILEEIKPFKTCGYTIFVLFCFLIISFHVFQYKARFK